jgi:hypothetical protein
VLRAILTQNQVVTPSSTREASLMSKKRKTIVPQFGTSRMPGRPLKPAQDIAPHQVQPPAPRIKPQSIPVKSSGHRGA